MATPKRLLKDMASLDHGAAMALLASTVRGLRPGEFDKYFDELVSLGDEGAHAAISGSTFVGHSRTVVEALAHTSAFVQKHAARALEFVPIDDAALQTTITSVSAEVRERCIGMVRRQARTELAERLVSSGELGDRDCFRLLAACSAKVASDRLDSLTHAATSWRNLARAHPDVVLRHFRSILDTTPASFQIVALRRWSSAFDALVELRPRELIALLSSVPNSPGALLSQFLPRLLRHEPVDTGEFLLSRPDLSWVLEKRSVCVALRKHDDAEPANQGDSVRLVVLIIRRCSANLRAVGNVLRVFAPSERPELLDEAIRDVDRANVLLPEPLLEVLPRTTRIAEAARMRSLTVFESDPINHERLTAFLEFEEAFETLVPITQRSDANERMRAYPLLVDAARRDRSEDALTRLMTQLQRLRNDQDPVRCAAITALRNVPATAFTEQHAPLLQQLARFVAEARDTSWSTRTALSQLLAALLVEHSVNVDSSQFQVSLQGISWLSGQSSNFWLPSLCDRLSAESATKFVDALLPFAARRAAEDNANHALAIAESVGRKGWKHQDLTNAVADIARHGNGFHTVLRAVNWWLADPATRVARAQSLVDFDGSYLMLGPVSAVADRQRQRLLDPMLEGPPLRGRFASSRDLATILLRLRWFHRWGDRRTAAYGARLRVVLQDNALTGNERIDATRVAALLPGVAHQIVIGEISADPKLIPRVEAGLAALSRTDRPDLALPLLLSYAGSDRARVAIFSVGRAARRCAPTLVGEQLCALASDGNAKITSRKEAIRLLAELLPPGADNVLSSLVGQPTAELHRDLRIALAWAGIRNPSRAWAGPAIDALAVGTMDEQRALLALNPPMVPTTLRSRVARHVIGLTGVDDLALRQRALSMLPIWSSASGSTADRAADAFRDLGERAWRVGAAALATMVFDGYVAPDILSACCAELVGHRETPSDRSRDIPAFQRLDTFVEMLAARSWPFRYPHRACITAVSAALGDPVFVVHRVRLFVATIDWRDPEPGLRALANLLRDHSNDRSSWLVLPGMIASSMWDQAGSSILESTADTPEHGHDAALWPPFPTWSALADEFVDTTSDWGPWIGLGLVQGAGHLSNWNGSWYSLLHRLRSHEDAAIRRLAYAVNVTTE